jgi:DNA primase
MSIPQSFIQDLLSRVDIVDVVGRHVQLKKAGANFSGLCPFHNEKSPSFTVSPTKQFYHCFGCGKNGNAIGFMMDYSGLHFVESIKDLAQSYGMVVPETEFSAEDKKAAFEHHEKLVSLTATLESAVTFYKKQLKSAPIAIEYLKKRGLSGEIAKQFGLGYALNEWQGLARAFTDYQSTNLVEAGLVIEKEEIQGQEKRYDRFRDRIMFPIRNVKGECIGFGGRVMGEGTPKYLNSPETAVFSKGRELYGLFEARSHIKESGFAIVTEGYMDVVALAQLGFSQAVATLGTACTNDHVQKLFRFTDTIVFAFDGDSAGKRAAKKALEVSLPFAKDNRSLKFLFLPPEHDPDSFIREKGVDAFSRAISSATPLSQFLMDVARQGCELSTAEGRALLATQAKPLWSALPTGVLKSQLLVEIGDLIGIGLHELRQLWEPSTDKSRSSKGKNTNRYSNSKEGNFANAQQEPSFARRNGSNTSQPLTAQHNPRGKLRASPMTREDRALQVLFSQMERWSKLSSEQQSLLCHLPPPHGLAFTWLDRQLNAQGVLHWSELKGMCKNESWSHWLETLIENMTNEFDSDTTELKSILFEMEKADISAKLTQMAPMVGSDPGLYKQFKSLSARFALLKTSNAV